MGEYAELAYEMELERYWSGDTDLAITDFSIWKCKDGRIISIKDMTDSHLTNTINMLKRKNNPLYEGWIYEMNLELKKRGLK